MGIISLFSYVEFIDCEDSGNLEKSTHRQNLINGRPKAMIVDYTQEIVTISKAEKLTLGLH